MKPAVEPQKLRVATRTDFTRSRCFWQKTTSGTTPVSNRTVKNENIARYPFCPFSNRAQNRKTENESLSVFFILGLERNNE